MAFLDYCKPLRPIFPLNFGLFPPLQGGIDREKNLCYILFVKAEIKTCVFGKKPREKPAGERLCFLPLMIPLLSCQPEMADRVRPLWREARVLPFVAEWRTRPQPGWNRGIHYRICIPPLIMSGVGYFYCLWNQKRRNLYV